MPYKTKTIWFNTKVYSEVLMMIKRAITILILTLLVLPVYSFAHDENTSTSYIDPSGNFRWIRGLKTNLAATAAPTTTDDITEGYRVGSMWVDITADITYICVDNTEDAAVWNLSKVSDALAGHPSDTGASHSYMDQSVTTTADPTFDTVTVTPFQRHIQLPAGASTLGPTAPSGVTYNDVIRCLEFDADNEASFITIEIPDDWVGGEDIEIEIDWLPNDDDVANGETVKWDFRYRSIAQGEDADGTLTSATATYTDVGGTAVQGTIIHTDLDLSWDDANNPLVKQDHLFIEVTRDKAGDSFPGGACITAWEWIYNSNTFSQI